MTLDLCRCAVCTCGSDPGPVQVCGVYLWFLQDSWCRPPLWFSGRQHRWLRPDRDRADSQLISRVWRRHRNHLYSAHSSNRLCYPDSHTLLDRRAGHQSVTSQKDLSKQSVSSVTCLGVAGITVSVAVAGLTGAEGSKFWTGAAISQSALLTVLTLVTLRTGALLHPAGWNTWTPLCTHQ